MTRKQAKAAGLTRSELNAGAKRLPYYEEMFWRAVRCEVPDLKHTYFAFARARVVAITSSKTA